MKVAFQNTHPWEEITQTEEQDRCNLFVKEQLDSKHHYCVNRMTEKEEKPSFADYNPTEILWEDWELQVCCCQKRLWELMNLIIFFQSCPL